MARWFGVATALATTPGGVGALPRDDLQVTSVALLRQRAGTGRYVRYLALLTPLKLTAADVDGARLVIPAGYRETRWPGFEHVPDLPARSRNTAAKWHTLPAIP